MIQHTRYTEANQEKDIQKVTLFARLLHQTAADPRSKASTTMKSFQDFAVLSADEAAHPLLPPPPVPKELPPTPAVIPS